MTILISTCLYFVFLLSFVVSSEVSSYSNGTVNISAICKTRINKANLPQVVLDNYCCKAIIHCKCYEALCKAESVKIAFCHDNVDVYCGPVGISSRCWETSIHFAANCAGANATCATDDNVKPYVSSTTSPPSSTSSSNIGLILGIVGALLLLIITIAFSCIFCGGSKSSSLTSASKSSLKEPPKEIFSQSKDSIQVGSKVASSNN